MLILAGYQNEAMDFMKRNDLNPMKCKSVLTREDLRGIARGTKIHVLPAYKNHPLCDEIMDMVKIRRLEVIEYDREGNGVRREESTNDH